jgi:hypothetical protein
VYLGGRDELRGNGQYERQNGTRDDAALNGFQWIFHGVDLPPLNNLLANDAMEGFAARPCINQIVEYSPRLLQAAYGAAVVGRLLVFFGRGNA